MVYCDFAVDVRMVCGDVAVGVHGIVGVAVSDTAAAAAGNRNAN